MALKPTVHAHLDSYRRPIDGKSKFSIRVDIDGNKKLYPVDTQGDQELYMDRKFWVSEVCQETGKQLKKKRIADVKGNGDAKKMIRVLNAKIAAMEKLISRLADADKSVTHDLLERLWSRRNATRFSDWATSWYEGYAKDNRHGKGTREAYGCALLAIRQFEDYNGPVKVSQVSADWLKQFQTWLYRESGTNAQGKVVGKGLSLTAGPRTMRRLGTMVKHAALDGEIFTNTYQEFRDRGYYQSEKTSIGLFLEADEVERLQLAYDSGELIDQVKTKKGNISPHGQRLHDRLAMILFACYTGLRYGDLVKVANGHRDVSISRTTLTVIMDKGEGRFVRLKITDKMRNVANLTGKGPVFSTPILCNNNMNHNLRRICRMVGITKHIKFHGLRRTFATMLLGMGERMKIVSALVGHSSVTTTESHYAKVADKSLEDAMDRFDTTYTEFTKPSVKEFVEDVFSLLLQHPELKMPRRMAKKIDALSTLLNLHDLEAVALDKGSDEKAALKKVA